MLLCTYEYVLFGHRHFSSSRLGSFLVLSVPGHAGVSPNPEHHGASVGPSRGPWHVLWRFKLAKIGHVTAGTHSEHVEQSRPMQTYVHVKNKIDRLRMSFSILLTAPIDCLCCLHLRTLILCVSGPLLCMCGHDVPGMYVCVVCVLRVRTAMVQQQSHSTILWNTCVAIAYACVCVICVLRYVNMCATTTYCCSVRRVSRVRPASVANSPSLSKRGGHARL